MPPGSNVQRYAVSLKTLRVLTPGLHCIPSRVMFPLSATNRSAEVEGLRYEPLPLVSEMFRSGNRCLCQAA
jgi:hypothetical protein